MRVVFTPRAARHLAKLHDWIDARSSPERADAYIERIVAFCRSLRLAPERGTRRDDLLPGLRTLGFERRVTVAYTSDGETIVVHAVAYAGRNFAADFAAPPTPPPDRRRR